LSLTPQRLQPPSTWEERDLSNCSDDVKCISGLSPLEMMLILNRERKGRRLGGRERKKETESKGGLEKRRNRSLLAS